MLFIDITSGNKGEEIAKKVMEELKSKNIGNNTEHLNGTNEDSMNERSAGSTQLNSIPILMTIVTIAVMAISAFYFVINV